MFKVKEDFIILVPPPNVTGSLHIGHALTLWIQDCLVKSQQLLGKKAYLWPGYDHGGIATFKIARKTLKKEDVSYEEIKTVALNNKEKITKQLKKMGLSLNWAQAQYTMNDDHIQLVQDSFIQLYKKGLIYRKKQIIAYDTVFQTALSNLEIEHKKFSGKIYEIPYQLADGTVIKVATTRPETIFADVALAVNPGDERYTSLIGKKALIPLENRWIPIIADDSVKIDFGTGVLKITPAHAPIDWEIGQKHSLPIINTINIKGKSIHTNSVYDNKNMNELKKIVVEELQCESKSIKQSLPYSSRSNSPIEYLVESQWFLNIKPLAEKALDIYPKFIPDYYLKTYNNWLKNIHPWCISRTIPWGQKIPAYYHTNGDVYIGHKPPEGYKSNGEVFDTWFSSALWPLLYENLYEKRCDILVTGYDIIFFWVSRMIMMHLYFKKTLPFPKTYIHGLVCDKKGKKMSKTVGNVLDPLDLIEEFSYESTRFGLLSALAYGLKIKFSKDNVITAKKILHKYENFQKYLTIINSPKHQLPKNLYEAIDGKINNYVKKYLKNIKNCEIPKQIKLTVEFLYWVCDWILEISKNYYIKPLLLKAQKTLEAFLYPFVSKAPNFQRENILELKEEKSYEIMNNLENTVKILRYLKKMSPITVEGPLKLLINHLILNKTEKNKIRAKMTFNDHSIYFEKTINTQPMIEKFQQELKKISKIPEHLQNQNRLQELKSFLMYLKSYKNLT